MSLKEIIALTFAYYHPGQSLADQVLLMYAEDLADIPNEDVIIAYQKYRRDPKNIRFPLPAKIREIVYPENYITPEEQAAEVAARITGAVTGCGWSNARAAEDYIGPVGWGVVQRQGGWMHICENLGVNINPSTFQAQIRRQLEANFKYGTNAIEESIGARLTGPRSEGLVSIGELFKQLRPPAKNEPEGAA